VSLVHTVIATLEPSGVAGPLHAGPRHLQPRVEHARDEAARGRAVRITRTQSTTILPLKAL
jgi:hypothetical protein